MVHISTLFDTEQLQEMITLGYVRAGNHPELPLRILGYTEKAQFERRWNDVTLNCRGIIVDEHDHIVARPWKKFFNLGEGFAEFDWDAPVEVTDKMDGSLGILYPAGDRLAIATRGSFDSDQARHATRILREKYSHIFFSMAYTFLFEIIYPANRIVLNYGDMDDLVLLGAVSVQHGYCLGPKEAAAVCEWDGPVTQVFEYETLQDAFSADPRPNAEGYVVRSGNKMVKIKQDDYIELHRIVTNLNERTIWERLAKGDSIDTICQQVPDEFHEFVRKVGMELERQYMKRIGEVVYEFAVTKFSLQPGFTRKEFAAAVGKSKDAKYMFAQLDMRPISGMIWQELKPSASKE